MDLDEILKSSFLPRTSLSWVLFHSHNLPIGAYAHREQQIQELNKLLTYVYLGLMRKLTEK